MTQNERVKEVRKSLNLTLEKFGERLGVTKQTISRIENGVNNLTEQMARSISREFGVDYTWLKTGEGENPLNQTNDMPNSTSERIKKVRKSEHLTLEKFGERLGVGKSAISNLEAGNRNLTEQMARLISREFGVDYTWLKTGEGEMYIEDDRNVNLASLTKVLLFEQPDSFKNRLISALAQLSTEQWEVLEEIAEKLAK